MALMQELYSTPASRLDSFVAQWLQPHREWKEEVLDAVRTVEEFLRQEHFQGKRGLDQDVRVLKVVKVGSFGNGTVLRSTREVELVAFLSCFHSFQEAAKHHKDVLRLIWKTMWQSQDLLDLGLEDLRMEQRVPDALVFTIQTRGTAEPITVTIVPAYRALGPSLPNSQPPPEVYVSLIKACGGPGNFCPSFSELQRNFVKHRPTKLKSLLRLVKHWYQQRARDIHLTVEQRGYPDFNLIVNPYEPIRKVKEKIRRTRGYSGLQRLSFQVPGSERQLLSSRCSLAKYGIFSHTHIYLLETIPSEIQVFVKNPDGGSYAYAINPNSFILGLKQQIEDQQGLPKKQQQLEFQGQVLQDWLGLGIYGIQDSDTLILSKKKGEALFPAS
ncbi:2'-5'-oligoadenylate synthetase like [Homo sapiens]|uniref:Isoform 3 of 2'-5'-oligoadenylate synthase-like protein n=1 Tax=Homo sapiens TaxID=9606 RepID=Q15646-3|nr:2'-5'-oligoadenylate synthase-like protein isoform c [Homo sapiens]AFJ00074.1 2'-5'-oligoadenylate synthetase-like transcript variant 4 [Homo sapiens]KAI2568363.1 2'-5'-oligoadenylate synthetase like [Homo sapiens]KAI4068614.1 2'-5'-oligoadenylate synthetase like [Homo sapiens]|eukprot:NP_001248754.1 2'-5'-oligoadenylate synthase-like protein isoform c [Homo sapiens]